MILSMMLAASIVTMTSAKGPGGGDGFPPGFSKGKKIGWRGTHIPPAWSDGKKRGWDGHGVPPGLR